MGGPLLPLLWSDNGRAIRTRGGLLRDVSSTRGVKRGLGEGMR